MFIEFNPNPRKRIVDDCVIRAICLFSGKTWDEVYTELCEEGRKEGDWANKNFIWFRYLEKLGFKQHLIPNFCPKCLTIREFCEAYSNGVYLLGTGDHVVGVIDGNYFDIWDSGDEIPVYYWTYG